METVVKQYSPHNVDTMVSDMSLFGWKEVDRHFNDSIGKYSVTFERDTSIAHYNEIVELEKKWDAIAKPIPMWPIWLFVIPALVLLSVFLALIITDGDKYGVGTYYCAFLIPAGLLLIGAVIYTAIRVSRINKSIKEAEAARAEIISELHRIKGEDAVL